MSIKINSRPPGKPRRWTNKEVEGMILDYNAGASYGELAAKHSANIGSIYRAMKRYEAEVAHGENQNDQA